MNILFIGDIVGAAGRNIVFQYLKQLKKDYDIDFVIANGENSAHGKGISYKIYERFKSEGIDCITMGNHSFSKREVIAHLDKMNDMVVPYNYPEDLHEGYKVFYVKGLRLCVINLLGSALMHPNRQDPFEAMDISLSPEGLTPEWEYIVYQEKTIHAGEKKSAGYEEILRYTLYENNEKEVTLDKELNFMRSYIELMKLRLGSNVKLTVDIPEDNVNHLKIAPLMFISMVENAFKHGVSSTKPSEISIKMTVNGNRVCCHVENSHFPKPETDKSGSGIGLSNLSRQLSLLYEGRHSFQSGVVGDKYVSDLQIEL